MSFLSLSFSVPICVRLYLFLSLSLSLSSTGKLAQNGHRNTRAHHDVHVLLELAAVALEFVPSGQAVHELRPVLFA